MHSKVVGYLQPDLHRLISSMFFSVCVILACSCFCLVYLMERQSTDPGLSINNPVKEQHNLGESQLLNKCNKLLLTNYMFLPNSTDSQDKTDKLVLY